MKYKNCKPYLIINNCRHGIRLRILPQYHLADGHPDGSTSEFTDYYILRLELDKPICTEIKIAEELLGELGIFTRDAMSVCTTLTYVYYTIFNLIKRQLTLAVHMLTTGL